MVGIVSLLGIAEISELSIDGSGARNQLAETAWKYRPFLAMSGDASILIRVKIVVSIVSLGGIAKMSDLRNDDFGVRNQYAETPWNEPMFLAMPDDALIFGLLPALLESAQKISGCRLFSNYSLCIYPGFGRCTDSMSRGSCVSQQYCVGSGMSWYSVADCDTANDKFLMLRFMILQQVGLRHPLLLN